MSFDNYRNEFARMMHRKCLKARAQPGTSLFRILHQESLWFWHAQILCPSYNMIPMLVRKDKTTVWKASIPLQRTLSCVPVYHFLRTSSVAKNDLSNLPPCQTHVRVISDGSTSIFRFEPRAARLSEISGTTPPHWVWRLDGSTLNDVATKNLAGKILSFLNSVHDN